LGAINPKDLNRIAKIGYGHLCLREENLIFTLFRYDEKRKIGNENDLVFGAINPESISLHHRFI
jgi:hypothetical protein